MENGAKAILAKHGCLYMKDEYKTLFEDLEAYYRGTKLDVVGSTLHPVGKLPEGSTEDVCHICRYKHECSDADGVYMRCLTELKSGEYYI